MTAQQECPDDNAEAPNTEPASKVSDSTSIGDQATRDGHSGGEATTNGRLSDDHLAILAKSGITPEYAALRGYETITDCRRLAKLKIVKAARDRVPGLLVPLLDIRGSTRGYQYRPDQPRLREGKFVKYETPWKQANGLDIPPGVGPMLADPTVPLWITEGAKKADCGALHGLCIVDLPGVWSFIHTNASGGKTAIPDWYDIALNGRRVILAFDGDVARKESVQKAARALAAYLALKGARVEYLWLPDTDAKTGLDDYLMAVHTVEDLWQLVKPHQPPVSADIEPPRPPPEPPRPPIEPIPLDAARDVFTRWFGDDYDTDALHVLIASAAVERFDDGSDPLWLLVVGGPGVAKTESVQALDDAGAVVTSSIASEGALLSASPRRDRAKDATGGLLRRIGDRGLLVIKDVTSILSMDRNIRAKVLAALREIYDGRWVREVGTDGGHTLQWRGRIVVVGAVTTAWDTAHAVVATMGDRFVLVRLDSSDTKGRLAAGRRAISNTGSEAQMRAELAQAVAGVLAGMNPEPITLNGAEVDTIMAAANLVTMARTGVEYDYRGDVIDAHAPEMPTRFGKQLTQIVRGAVAVGMNRHNALRLAIRCARDSMPPLRLAIIDDVAAHPKSTTTDVRKRLNKPRNTIDRQLQALHMLGVLTVEEEVRTDDGGSVWWRHSLAEHIDPRTILVPEMLLTAPNPTKETDTTQGGGDDAEAARLRTHISGTTPSPTPPTRRPPPRHGQHDPEITETDAVANVCDIIGATVVTTATKATDAQNAAYTEGLCVDCLTEPHSPGRSRCDKHHSAWLTTIDGHDRSAWEVSDLSDPSATQTRPAGR